MDKRWKQLGDILVNYSTAITAGRKRHDRYGRTGDAAARARRLRSRSQGRRPQVQFLSRRCDTRCCATATSTRLAGARNRRGMNGPTSTLGLRGAHNLYELAGIPGDVLAVNQKAMGVISPSAGKTTLVLGACAQCVVCPTSRDRPESMMDMFFDACLLDWKEAAQEWRSMTEKLQSARGAHRRSRDGPPLLSCRRKWLVLDGKLNLPDGEILTAGEQHAQWPHLL